MEAVLSTTELLEAILLNLDMSTLLVSALRVSKTWNSAITHSPALQRALYFLPVPGYQELAVPQLDPMFSFNPLLVKKFTPLFFDSISEEIGYARRANSFYALPWTIAACTEFEVRDQRGSVDLAFRYSSKPLGIADSDPEAVRKEQALRRHFTRRGASWRRMLVSQPPPSRLGYFWIDSWSNVPLQPYGETGRTVSVALVNPDPHAATDDDRGRQETSGGLRMGQLYDLVQQHAGHHNLPAVWFRVLWGRMREPFYCDHCRDTCGDLLSKAGVVVEFVDGEPDNPWENPHRDPPDTDIFDQIFRCDEHHQLTAEPNVVRAQQMQIPSYPGGARVKESTTCDASTILSELGL